VAVERLEATLAAPEPRALRALVLASAPTGWPRTTLEAVAVARAQGLHVTTPARFSEDLFQRTPLDALDDPWLVLDEALTRRSALYVGTKRLMDLVLGGLALVLASPLFLVIAILVRLSGPGPILDGPTPRTARARCGPPRTTRARRAWGGSCAARAWTSCPSSSTSCAGT